MAPVVGYWYFRGLGEPIRTLLHYVDAVFEDKRYQIGPAPDCDITEWKKDKPSLGLDFPNLPYYIDGEVKLTQTLAILRYLGRKHGLSPGNAEQNLCRVEIMEQQIIDLLHAFVRLVYYSGKFETEKEGYIAALQDKLSGFSTFLGDGPWMLGKKITYVDFLLYEMLDWHLFLAPNCLDSFANLKAFMHEFKTLPNIAKYFSSGQFKKWPIINPFAQFGGTGDAPEV